MSEKKEYVLKTDADERKKERWGQIIDKTRIQSEKYRILCKL